VVETFGIGAGRQPAGVTQHLPESEPLPHVTQLRQMIGKGGVQVEIAIGDQDHRCRRGERLGDRTDRKGGIPGNPAPGTVLQLADLHGDRFTGMVYRELSRGYPMSPRQRGQPTGDEGQNDGLVQNPSHVENLHSGPQQMRPTIRVHPRGPADRRVRRPPIALGRGAIDVNIDFAYAVTLDGWRKVRAHSFMEAATTAPSHSRPPRIVSANIAMCRQP